MGQAPFVQQVVILFCVSVCSPPTHFISSTSVFIFGCCQLLFCAKAFPFSFKFFFFRFGSRHLFPSQQYLPKISLSSRSVKAPFAIYVRDVQILKVVNVNVEGGRKGLKVWNFDCDDVRRFQELPDDALSLLTFPSASVSVNEYK